MSVAPLKGGAELKTHDIFFFLLFFFPSFLLFFSQRYMYSSTRSPLMLDLARKFMVERTSGWSPREEWRSNIGLHCEVRAWLAKEKEISLADRKICGHLY